jgi:hypothetical protein
VASVEAHLSGLASASLNSFVRVFDVDTNATLEAPLFEDWQLRFNPHVGSGSKGMVPAGKWERKNEMKKKKMEK